MTTNTIDLDEVKKIVETLNAETGHYCCVQFICSKFGSSERTDVQFSLSVGHYGSGLHTSIADCMDAYRKYLTDYSAMEKEVADLEKKAEMLRGEIIKRKANHSEIPNSSEVVA